MRKNIFFILFVFFGLLSAVDLTAQSAEWEDWPDERGDPAIAEKYLLWAEDAIASGRWDQAHAALERAADFADVSSDISYLLALVRSHENEDRRLVIDSLERAIGTKRWKYYTEAQARLLQADQLITLRRYPLALATLAAYKAAAGETADLALLRLAALKGLINSGVRPGPGLVTLPVPVEFRSRMLETLDRYPRDPRPLRILLDYARERDLDKDDIALVEIALRRLSFLLEADPELAWMAAPFITDDAQARRLVSAYRAGSLKPRADVGFKPNPASLIPALNLGLIDDINAADELFEETTLEKDIIVKTGDLLRSGEGRDYFVRKLHSFTGAITEDGDGDGYAESRAVYRQGNLQEYYCDTDQNGITDLFVSFNAGTPQRAEITILPAALPTQGNGRAEALILWERYPAVQRAVLGSESYLPAPAGFQFAPVNFTELGATDNYAGLLFPLRNLNSPDISRQMLASFSASVQRPSAEFERGVEQVFLERGIPIRAEVTLNGTLVSALEFENGHPLIQRLDLDLDGRMETVRRFRPPGTGTPSRGQSASGGQNALQSSESGWNADGAFSTAELYLNDGSIVYSWDLDGDGKREYSENR